jgi:hypothetical protein
MKTRFAIVTALGGMLLFIDTSADAHHSFAGTYLEDGKPVTIEGTLKAFLIRNPHTFVTVETTEKDARTGEFTRWNVEWGAAGQLAQQGVREGTLKVGDHVIVTGSPGRNPEDHRMRMRTLVRPKQGNTPEFSYGLQGQTFQ